MIERACTRCRKVFHVWPKDIRRGGGKFCSRQCADGMRSYPNKRGRPSAKVSRICGVCGSVFLVKQCEINRGSGKWCSTTCFHAAQIIPVGRQLLQNISEPNEHGCILWTGTTMGNGYGVFFSKYSSRRRNPAHRFAFELAYGPITHGMHVLHRCDECYQAGDITYRRCVNPEHLFLGTQTENNADKIAKGRYMKGERCYFAKATEDAVRDMRRRFDAGEASQIELAKEYRMTNTNVSHIVRRLTWKHVI